MESIEKIEFDSDGRICSVYFSPPVAELLPAALADFLVGKQNSIEREILACVVYSDRSVGWGVEISHDTITSALLYSDNLKTNILPSLRIESILHKSQRTIYIFDAESEVLPTREQMPSIIATFNAILNSLASAAGDDKKSIAISGFYWLPRQDQNDISTKDKEFNGILGEVIVSYT